MNKKSLIIVFFVLFISGLSGQQKDEFGVYLNAEKMPIIEGGMAAIGKKIRYPKIAREMGIQGVVYVGFVVNEKGEVKDGGFFGAAEVVLRSGKEPVGEWIEEEVNAYKDFVEIHNHEPAPKAWGISLQSGPGVEVDFGSIEISEE